MSRTYKSGEKPIVGDKVKVINRRNNYSYGTLSLREHGEYVVKGVFEGSKSTLISVDGGYANFKASRFSLIERSSSYENAVPPQYVVVNQNGKVCFSAVSRQTLTEKLSNALKQNPMEQLNIFKYETTARTSTPLVEYVNIANTPINLDHVKAEPEMSPSDSFRKL